MQEKILPGLLALILALTGLVQPGAAKEASITAKHWPPGYFFRYQKLSVPEKEKILAKIDQGLEKLRKAGHGLIAKGAVIEKLSPQVKVYKQLTILDESGLIIVVRNVPNLYFNYRDPARINPNTFLIIKNPRVNVAESFIRYGYVVEGDYAAYAQKFVSAIMEGLEAGGGE